jgi:hypothetical protein
MTRLWSPAEPITVVTVASSARGPDGVPSRRGPPARFSRQGQTHAVAHITRAWRVDIDWWRERIWRAFYKLSTDTGLLVIIFQDLLTYQWYFLRLYD